MTDPKVQLAKEYMEAHPRASLRAIAKAADTNKDTIARWKQQGLLSGKGTTTHDMEEMQDTIVGNAERHCGEDWNVRQANLRYVLVKDDDTEKEIWIAIDNLYLDAYGNFIAHISVRYGNDDDYPIVRDVVDLGRDSQIKQFISDPMRSALQGKADNVDKIVADVTYVLVDFHSALMQYMIAEPETMISLLVKERMKYHASAYSDKPQRPRYSK